MDLIYRCKQKKKNATEIDMPQRINIYIYIYDDG